MQARRWTKQSKIESINSGEEGDGYKGEYRKRYVRGMEPVSRRYPGLSPEDLEDACYPGLLCANLAPSLFPQIWNLQLSKTFSIRQTG